MDSTAQMYRADGTTAVGAALVEGTDFSASFMPAPDCVLYFRMLTPAAAIEPNNRLIVRYQAYLDNDSERNATLTNIAAPPSGSAPTDRMQPMPKRCAPTRAR